MRIYLCTLLAAARRSRWASGPPLPIRACGFRVRTSMRIWPSISCTASAPAGPSRSRCRRRWPRAACRSSRPAASTSCRSRTPAPRGVHPGRRHRQGRQAGPRADRELPAAARNRAGCRSPRSASSRAAGRRAARRTRPSSRARDEAMPSRSALLAMAAPPSPAKVAAAGGPRRGQRGRQARARATRR